MMTQRNLELQLQAIDMIERKHRQMKKPTNHTEASTSGEMKSNEVVETKTPINDVTKEELE